MASERVRVAARLSEWFPLLAEAMDRGELSFAHAARLIRSAAPEVLDGLQSIEPDLVRLASSQTFEQFERDLLMIVDRLNPDGPAPDESRINQVRITNEFGNTRVSGLLDPVRGEIVANALKQSIDAIRREREQQGQEAEPGPSDRQDWNAGAPEDEVGRGHENTPGCSAAGGCATSGSDDTYCNGNGSFDDNESGNAISGSNGNAGKAHADHRIKNGRDPSSHSAQPMKTGLGTDPGDQIGALQAEGLIRICQTALSASDLAGSIPTAHIDVIVRADHPTVATTRNAESVVPIADMAPMSCNAIYRVISMDATGVPLRMGRARRLATPDQRRAVFARDGGCIFPGCGAPARDCDVHHVHHWSDGGSTDVENLASLCRFHHSVTHSIGWTMNPAAPDDCGANGLHFEWRTPTGALLKSERRIPGAAARLADKAADELALNERSPKTPGKLSQEPVNRGESDGTDEPGQSHTAQ